MKNNANSKNNKNRQHRKTTGIKSPLPRKVHLGQDEWTYTVGQGRLRSDLGLGPAVIIRSPDGKHTQEFSIIEVLKVGGSGSKEVTPGTVKEFLMDQFGGSVIAFKDRSSEKNN